MLWQMYYYDQELGLRGRTAHWFPMLLTHWFPHCIREQRWWCLSVETGYIRGTSACQSCSWAVWHVNVVTNVLLWSGAWAARENSSLISYACECWKCTVTKHHWGRTSAWPAPPRPRPADPTLWPELVIRTSGLVWERFRATGGFSKCNCKGVMCGFGASNGVGRIIGAITRSLHNSNQINDDDTVYCSF